MAVGFEWQCSWMILKSNVAPENEKDRKYFPKNTVLKRGLGWKLVTDGPELEFVTDPVPLNLKSENFLAMDGETALQATMNSIRLFCADLDALKAKASIVRADNRQLFLDFPSPFVIVPRPENETLQGFVQITGGIRLSKLRKLFKTIGTADSQEAKDFLGIYYDAYSHALRRVHLKKANFVDPRWPEHQPSTNMRSLVELIALYMTQFIRRSPTAKAKVVKYLTFIMARTDFGRLFQEMDASEVTYYTNAPDRWVDYICTHIMGQIEDVPSSGLLANSKLVEYPVDDRGTLPADKLVSIPITRREWLVGMTKGQDLLTAAAHPIGLSHPINRIKYREPSFGHRLRGLGGLGPHMDTVAMEGLDDTNGAVFEFRGQQEQLQYTAWAAYAVHVYRFLQTVNFGQQNA